MKRAKESQEVLGREGCASHLNRCKFHPLLLGASSIHSFIDLVICPFVLPKVGKSLEGFLKSLDKQQAALATLAAAQSEFEASAKQWSETEVCEGRQYVLRVTSPI